MSKIDGRGSGDSDWFANLFLWLMTGHLYLVLAFAAHELVAMVIDLVEEGRAQWRDWRRLKPGRRCCTTCKCLCHRRRVERALYEGERSALRSWQPSALDSCCVEPLNP